MDYATIRYDDALDAAIIEFTRPVTSQDVAHILQDHIEPNLPRNMVWVIGEGIVSALTTDDLKNFIVTRIDKLARRSGGHTIYVVPGESENALFRWYCAYNEKVAKAPVAMHVVKDLDEGIRLLEDQHRNSAHDAQTDRA